MTPTDPVDPRATEETLLEVRPPSSSSEIGGYRIVERIGQGGMGVLYRVRDAELEKDFAVKVIHDELAKNPEFLKRLKVEAKLACRVESPNTVPILRLAEDRGRWFCVMPYVAGKNLAAWVRERETPLEMDEALRLVEEAALGLAAIHRQGIVHRDVKPENMLVTAEGHLLVTDFGLARDTRADTRISSTGHVLGTPHYMAPEQAETSDVDLRADVYSLGITFFFILTGKPPYDGPSALSVLDKHRREPLPDPAATNPRAVGAPIRLLRRMAAKDPRQRPPSMEAVLEEIRAIRARRPAAAPAGAGGSRRRKFIIASSAVGLVLALSAALAIAIASRETPAENGGSANSSTPKNQVPPPPGIDSEVRRQARQETARRVFAALAVGWRSAAIDLVRAAGDEILESGEGPGVSERAAELARRVERTRHTIEIATIHQRLERARRDMWSQLFDWEIDEARDAWKGVQELVFLGEPYPIEDEKRPIRILEEGLRRAARTLRERIGKGKIWLELAGEAAHVEREVLGIEEADDPFQTVLVFRDEASRETERRVPFHEIDAEDLYVLFVGLVNEQNSLPQSKGPDDDAFAGSTLQTVFLQPSNTDWMAHRFLENPLENERVRFWARFAYDALTADRGGWPDDPASAARGRYGAALESLFGRGATILWMHDADDPNLAEAQARIRFDFDDPGDSRRFEGPGRALEGGQWVVRPEGAAGAENSTRFDLPWTWGRDLEVEMDFACDPAGVSSLGFEFGAAAAGEHLEASVGFACREDLAIESELSAAYPGRAPSVEKRRLDSSGLRHFHLRLLVEGPTAYLSLRDLFGFRTKLEAHGAAIESGQAAVAWRASSEVRVERLAFRGTVTKATLDEARKRHR